MTTTINYARCDYPRCDGHLGKFDSCLTEALYNLTLDGFDESTGSAEAYGHFTLMIFTEPTLTVDETTPNHPVMIPADNYVLRNAESGAVYLARYDTETDARAAYDAEDLAYAEWLGDEPF